MLKCYSSLKFNNHYYCYLDSDIFLINKDSVGLVDKEDKLTNTIIERYKDKEITDQLLTYQLKYLIDNYLLNSITNYNNLINKYTELHKDLNNNTTRT